MDERLLGAPATFCCITTAKPVKLALLVDGRVELEENWLEVDSVGCTESFESAVWLGGPWSSQTAFCEVRCTFPSEESTVCRRKEPWHLREKADSYAAFWWMVVVKEPLRSGG